MMDAPVNTRLKHTQSDYTLGFKSKVVQIVEKAT